MLGVGMRAEVARAAGTYYVRSGATGTNMGTDWTNAYPSLPSTLERGATYYVAAGTYGSYTFDDPVSGTAVITIKKATTGDHGITTGWQDGYGSGAASWAPVVFTTSYWVFDGATGGGPGSWTSGHGFEIATTTSVCGDATLIGLGANVSDIQVLHTTLYSSSKNYPLNGVKGTGGATNLRFSHLYMYSIFGVPFHMGTWSNVTIENSYIADTRSTGAVDAYCPNWHTEGISSIGNNTNLTIRNNIWDKIQGTAVFAGVNKGSSTGWKIYGNVFSRNTTTMYYYYEASSSTNQQTMDGLEFYNNVITGIPGVSQGGLVIQQGTNNKVYNNIWYDNIANAFGINATHDNNYFSNNRRVEGCSPSCPKDVEAASGETSAQITTVNPFVNWNSTLDPASADFHLTQTTNGGLILSSPFNIDAFGNTRGADGTWDRGAYEYTGSTPPPPPPPTTKSTTKSTTKFITGDRIKVTTNKRNVRKIPGGKNIGFHRINDQGTVLEGPQLANGYNWYNINFDTSPDGWTVQDYLEKTLVVVYTPSPTLSVEQATQLSHMTTVLSLISKLLQSTTTLSTSMTASVANALTQIQQTLVGMRR